MTQDMMDYFTAERPLVLVGCGNMGRAMMKGWLKGGLSPQHLKIIDPSYDPARDDLPGDCAIASAENMPKGVVAGALILAVKPQIMEAASAPLGDLMDERTIALSVAAGLTTERLKSFLPKAAKLVRTMPNTPAAIGAGMTGLFADGLSEGEKSVVEGLMRATGKTLWVDDEELMDAVTGVSGSGPAYIFHLVEALAAAGAAVGLKEADAMTLARQTIIGAARLLEAEADTPASGLREQVTSPGGTTAAGLKVLMGEEALSQLMTKAVTAARDRGRELGA